MSLAFLTSSIKDLADFMLPKHLSRPLFILTSDLTIERTEKCNGVNLKCHGYNKQKHENEKLPGHDCRCTLFRCSDCTDIFWVDEDSDDNMICYACEDNMIHCHSGFDN